MMGGVTRLGGLPGVPGRVTLSAGMTICHVNVSRWGNPPSRLTAEITRNRKECKMFTFRNI